MLGIAAVALAFGLLFWLMNARPAQLMQPHSHE
jgi:hypothetical protein